MLPFIPEKPDSERAFSDVGIAVDAGTTTIAVSVWTLGTRECLATAAEKNAQARYGHDIIKRISFATRPPLAGSAAVLESGPSALHYTIIAQLERLFSQAVLSAQSKMPRGFQPRVKRIVIAGNTTMLSFICAFPVDGLGTAPFSAASLFGFAAKWGDVRSGTCSHLCQTLDVATPELLQKFEASAIRAETPVYFPPCIGAFIGADTVCAMLAAEFPIPGSKSAELTDEGAKNPLLLADIGTNCEIVLYIPENTAENKAAKILCTSAAAGPAFEAANIACGISSVSGAIDKIERIDGNGNLVCHVIGGARAIGICGSGLVSAIALLLKNKYIDENGVLQKAVSRLGDGAHCIQLTPAVYISQQDIRNLQLAKAAVKTGIAYMIERASHTFSQIPAFYIAGGFGARIDMNDAQTIGLIPKELGESCRQLGNAALFGAASLLFSKTLRHKAVEIAKKSYQINLAAVPEFQKRYLNSINF